MRAAMAESFGNFEKSVQNVGNLSKGVSGSPAKKTVKKS